MALSPIAFIAPNYRDFKTYWLKVYEPGTTTPKTMALDSAGVVTVAKLELNADGFLESAGGALVIPYIDGAYDAWLFPTEAEADANDTVNAEQVADDIIGVSGVGVNELSVKKFDTLDDAITETSPLNIFDGAALNIKERTAGNGGGAMWDVIAGTGTANGNNIIAHNTLDLSMVYRPEENVRSYETTDDVIASLDLTIGESLTTNDELGSLFKVEVSGDNDGIDSFLLNNGSYANRITSLAGDQYYSYKQRFMLAEQMKKLRNHTPIAFTWYGDSNSVRNNFAVQTAFRGTLQGAYGTAEINANIDRATSGYSAKVSFETYTTNHSGNITVINFGTNDASTQFGYPQDGNIQQYLRWMERLVIRELNWGHPCVLVTPLPTRFDKAFERPGIYTSPSDPFPTVERADSYLMGEALKYLGAKYSIPVLDSVEAMAPFRDEMFVDSTQSINLNTSFGDPVHLDTVYSPYWGARLAAQFVGDLVMNAPSVSDGDMLTITKGFDPFAIKSSRNPDQVYAYFANSAEASFARGDEHIGNRCQLITAAERVTYSFYAETDNLIIYPTIMVFASSTATMFLDNNETQPPMKIDNGLNSGSFGPIGFGITTTTNTVVNRPFGYPALATRDEQNSHIWIPTKGWHTFTILCDAGSVAVSGLNIFSVAHKDLELLKLTVANIGSTIEWTTGDPLAANDGQKYYATGGINLPPGATEGTFIKYQTSDIQNGSLEFSVSAGTSPGDIWTKYLVNGTWGAWNQA